MPYLATERKPPKNPTKNSNKQFISIKGFWQQRPWLIVACAEKIKICRTIKLKAKELLSIKGYCKQRPWSFVACAEEKIKGCRTKKWKAESYGMIHGCAIWNLANFKSTFTFKDKLAPTHTHTRTQQKRTLEKQDKAAEDKTWWHFQQGLVYRAGWTRKNNCKTQQQKEIPPLNVWFTQTLLELYVERINQKIKKDLTATSSRGLFTCSGLVHT